jgi:hypothetical protein
MKNKNCCPRDVVTWSSLKNTICKWAYYLLCAVVGSLFVLSIEHVGYVRGVDAGYQDGLMDGCKRANMYLESKNKESDFVPCKPLVGSD